MFLFSFSPPSHCCLFNFFSLYMTGAILLYSHMKASFHTFRNAKYGDDVRKAALIYRWWQYAVCKYAQYTEERYRMIRFKPFNDGTYRIRCIYLHSVLRIELFSALVIVPVSIIWCSCKSQFHLLMKTKIWRKGMLRCIFTFKNWSECFHFRVHWYGAATARGSHSHRIAVKIVDTPSHRYHYLTPDLI